MESVGLVAGADVCRQRQAEADRDLEVAALVATPEEVQLREEDLEVVTDHSDPLLAAEPARDVPHGGDSDLDIDVVGRVLAVEDADGDVAFLQLVERGAECLRDELGQVGLHLGGFLRSESMNQGDLGQKVLLLVERARVNAQVQGGLEYIIA
ncbi:MAG: hypothetical protein JWM52_710 [Candidatus Saccharibacteria bacterium]|nr:hypothetical protein [Candidatus Saccharibacteria bacterium]